MKIEKVKINSITENPDNPRTIKGEKFNKLVKSIKDFPEMLKIRPIVVNDDNVILGGNMRYKASIRAGLSEVHIIRASGLTDEQQKEFIAKDNVGFGEWDWDVLANEWDVEKLEDWGIEVPSLNDFMDEHEPEIEFSEFLDESNNYVVLFFKNDIDWLQAQTHFSLKSVSSKRSNGKAWSKGIGRVINGAEYLNKK
ncbi:MAG: ParB-like chromosome segregation protein Spo0J [Polaribacter sp.]|jgi:ParB-like chromosome segregation protein Spo0J|tara:strand:+ start:104 stop:691 length:588 start_codon:yes stop_codon:yes gene_type:complete